jgi:hypothetical protein
LTGKVPQQERERLARAILGPSLTSVMSFNGIVCGGYLDLGIVIDTRPGS